MRRRRRSTLAAAEILLELGRQQLTVDDLYSRTGIPVSVLNRKLTGNAPIDLNDIDRIARALGVPVDALICTARTRGTNGGPNRT